MASSLSGVSESVHGLDTKCQPNVSTQCRVHVASIFISPLVRVLHAVGDWSPMQQSSLEKASTEQHVRTHVFGTVFIPTTRVVVATTTTFACCILQFKLAPRDTWSLDRQAAKLAPKTAGKQWFDLPAQQMTDETKRDLKLLQLRGTFDPKRFYKSSDHKKGLPKFFQIGTVVASSADFYSGTVLAMDSLHFALFPSLFA